MMAKPSTTGAIGGRSPSGQFAPGNGFGKGNPFSQTVARLRAELLNAVTPEALRDVVAALLEKAKGGDVAACREILDRTIGKAAEGADFHERLDRLERLLGGANEPGNSTDAA